MNPRFERHLFDLIETISRTEREGSFSRALMEAINQHFGPQLRIVAAATFKPQGLRYEPVYSVGAPLWATVDGALSAATLRRRLAGHLWWIQRGLRPPGQSDVPQAEHWYDLILIPVARDLGRVLGLLTESLAGEEGAAREEQFQVMGQLIRLFVDRHQQRARLREIFTLARQQQLSLLPTELPAAPGYRLAARSVAAEEVGGDYYHTFLLPQNLLGFAVADAKGKGFEAAVQVTGLHAALRLVNDTPFKLVHKIGLVNRAMVQQAEFRNLISLFLGEVDSFGRLLYVNCSHPPALLLRRDGIEELSEGGRFLGLDVAGEYRFGIAEMRSGDLLVAYTDGWTELFNEHGEEFGPERLRELLRPLHGAEPEEVMTRLQAAADLFRGDGGFRDDRTVFVLRKD